MSMCPVAGASWPVEPSGGNLPTYLGHQVQAHLHISISQRLLPPRGGLPASRDTGHYTDIVYKYYLWIYFQRKLKYCSDWLELSEKLYKGRNYQRLLIQYEWMNAAGRNHRIIIKLNTLYPLLLSFRQNTPIYSSQPNDTHMSKYLRPKYQAKHY